MRGFTKHAKDKVKAKVRSVSTHISDRIGSKLIYLKEPQWCSRKAGMIQEYILNKSSLPLTEFKANTRVWEHYFELMRDSVQKKKELLIKKFKGNSQAIGPWKSLWKYKEAKFREASPYSHFNSLKIRPMIFKAGDDLRQELMALNLIRYFKSIFERENMAIYLRPYDVIIANHDSGYIGRPTLLQSSSLILFPQTR